MYICMFGLRRVCSQFFDLLVMLCSKINALHYSRLLSKWSSNPWNICYNMELLHWSYNATQSSISLLYSFDMIIYLHYAGIIIPCINQILLSNYYNPIRVKYVTHTYIHSHIYIPTHKHTHINVHTHIHVHTHIRTGIYIYTHIHVYVHTHTHVHT